MKAFDPFNGYRLGRGDEADEAAADLDAEILEMEDAESGGVLQGGHCADLCCGWLLFLLISA